MIVRRSMLVPPTFGDAAASRTTTLGACPHCSRRDSWCDWLRGIDVDPKRVCRVEVESTPSGDTVTVTEYATGPSGIRIVSEADGSVKIVRTIRLSRRDWPGVRP
jgi:hypothetical protein